MERNNLADDKEHLTLIKIMSNHINYLENEVLVYENIIEEIDHDNITDNNIENLKEEEIYDANLIQNIENSYFYYLKSLREEIDKMNFIFFQENEKVKRKLSESQKQLEEYKFKINLSNNEINEVTKQKKILEEKVFSVINTIVIFFG